ncbi:MAG: iron-sulfur cluster carrier protein ApbC [Ostreibacterium sp.]
MFNIAAIENLGISSEIPILGKVANVKKIGKTCHISLGFYDDKIAERITHLITSRYPVNKVNITLQTEPKTVQPNVMVKKNINNIIAVASGKGGVGKSSTAINLALSMAKSGAKVGILDADIYGPSQPTMLGIHERPEIIGEKTMKPNFSHGIESNSIGYLVEPDTPMIWRAPMIVGGLNQLINDTDWGNHFDGTLDYLLIDLPPGTGDIQLSMAQKIPVTGAVTVTTPQDIALIDARRSIKMFEKMQIDNLGIIENMSIHICENCGHESPIFGEHGGRNIATQFGVPFLGDIPLDIALRKSLDNGLPLVIAQPEHPITQRYHNIARQIAIAIAKKPKNFSGLFGKISVENQ